MFTLILLAVAFSSSISFCCSLMESSLFAFPKAYARYLADTGTAAGKRLYDFKENMSKPIAAILILNTIANTLGASVAGALVVAEFGEAALVPFSAVYTVIILYFSEILPKQIGGMYSKSIGPFIALPLSVLIRLLYPVILTTEWFSRLVGSNSSLPQVSYEEVVSLAELGREEGVIDHLEDSVIRNVVGLDKVLVKHILTPRVVVFRLDKDALIGDLKKDIVNWNHTRIPLYSKAAPDQLESYIIQRDLYRAMLRGEDTQPLAAIARPLSTVPELMRADQLLLRMFERRESICAVVDEHGGLAGIITMEDVIEEIVGREILDEYDLVGDLRSYAQILYRSSKKRNDVYPDNDD